MQLLKLFLIFVKIGAILLGGGYVILPILQNELAEKRQIIAKDDLVEYFALSQSLPGIVAANISMFIGYRLHGKTGALTAMLGVIFVPFLCIITLASVLSIISDIRIVQGVMWGVGIAVIALIILSAGDIWKNSNRNLFFCSIFLLSLSSLLIFKLSPICVIITFSLLGVIIKLLRKNRR